MKRNLILFLVAVLVGGLLAVGVSFFKRGSTDGKTPPGKTAAKAPRQLPSQAQPSGKAAALAALAPPRTAFFLATDDLGKLGEELNAGPVGRIAAAPSVKGFLDLLRREPAGEMGLLCGMTTLVFGVARISDGPAFVVCWAPQEGAAPAAGFAARVKDGSQDPLMTLVAGALAASGDKVRDEPVGPGQVCKTAARPNREGVAWGFAGRWIVLANSVAGCKSLLEWVARPAGGAPADAELAKAISAAGDGRLVGGANLRELFDAETWTALGLEPSGWLGYAARASSDCRWTERMSIGGKLTGGGTISALAAGGERPVLAGLPDSTLVCISANVADGGKLWTGLLQASAEAGADGDLKNAAEALARAGGRNFAADVAPAFKGDFTAAWILPRQSFIPQTILGARLAPGAAEKLAPVSVAALKLFGEGGAVEQGEHNGARLQWLSGARGTGPLCPAPTCAFKGDLFLAGSSPVAVRDFLDGRGGKLLSPAEAGELGAGLFGARASLTRLMPFIWSEADAAGLWDGLADGPSKHLPLSEEVGAPLGDAVLVVSRGPQGLLVEVRGPLPLAAALATLQLERNR